jgi:23S rRNA pseudouridine1911/1915/1917 synthase
MSREARTLSVPEGVAGERIDSALTRVLGLSRTAIVRLLEDGDITTGGRAMSKSERVTNGQVIEVLMPEPLNQDPIPLTPLAGLTVVYDDEDIVVIDKPVGCAAHPSPGWMGPTVVGALTAAGYTISTSGPAERAGIVHRLDKDTSGVMVVAKNDRAHQDLQAQIQSKTARREYLGIVRGVPKGESGVIDAAIARHKSDRKKMAVIPDGRKAITHWQIQERLGNYTLVKFDLETGRTHQIRVHSAYMGWAIAGDPVYGYPNKETSQYLAGQALHAWRLTFTRPVSGALIENTAPIPEGFEKLLVFLRRRK